MVTHWNNPMHGYWPLVQALARKIRVFSYDAKDDMQIGDVRYVASAHFYPRLRQGPGIRVMLTPHADGEGLDVLLNEPSVHGVRKVISDPYYACAVNFVRKVRVRDMPKEDSDSLDRLLKIYSFTA